MMRRIFDILAALILTVLMAFPMVIIALAVKLTSKGPVLYWSDRVGINNSIFRMPKFRTMRPGTPFMATHLLKEPENYITVFGKFLRKTSLDELPQLFSILCGDMTFVGPRPAASNQYDLIEQRTQKGVHKLTPGITGWAQVNGRDSLPIPVKVEFDEYYLKNRSSSLDLKILFMTIVKALRAEDVQH